MSPVEILFALQRIPPFESVTDGELEIAAKVLVVLLSWDQANRSDDF